MNKGRLKKILTHLGLHLHRRGLLLDPRDIFGLTAEQAEDVARQYEEAGMEVAAERAASYMGICQDPNPSLPLDRPASNWSPGRTLENGSMRRSDPPSSDENDENLEIASPSPVSALEALGLCGMCLRRVAVRHRHHVILRRSEGGPDAEWNLMPLCPECHSFVHSHPLIDAVAVWLKMREASLPELDFVPERVLRARELPESLQRVLMGEETRIPLEEQKDWPPFLSRLVRLRAAHIRRGGGA